jgi:hypothetical protein
LATGTGGTELPDQQAQGAVGVVEPLGDFLLGTTFDEDGAERFVLALAGARGFEEEASDKRIVHGCGSEC